MVTPLALAEIWWPGSFVVLADQAAELPLEQLDPPRRAAVVMALLALVLTGMLLVAIAMLGANWARRLARHRPNSRRSSRHVAIGSNSQMRDALRDVVRELKTDDTVQINPGAGDTKVDRH